jgi:hypothetical protein
MSKETRLIWGGIFIIVVLLLVFTCGAAHGSPGDDGCVGNCDGDNGNNGVSSIANTVTTTSNPTNTVNNTSNPTNQVSNTNNPTNTVTTTVSPVTSVSTVMSPTNTVSVSSPNTNTNKVSNTNRNTNNSSANATGGIGYGGNSTAGANSISGGGSAVSSIGPQTTNVSVTENNPGNIRYGGSYTVKSVGVAPDISTYSTAPCRVAIGASGGWIGGSVGFAGSVLDDGCDVWRDHVNLRASGHLDGANIRLCDKPELAKVLDFCKKEGRDTSVAASTSGFVH